MVFTFAHMNFKQAKRYLANFGTAKNLYRIHSPFVYQFAEMVLEDDRFYYAFEDLEFLRTDLKQLKEPLERIDYHQNSKEETRTHTTVAKVARQYQSDRPSDRMLFRLVNWLKPKYMLELGTSLGISTMYQAYAALDSRLSTIEGCPETAGVALDAFKFMDIKNIDLHVGRWDVVLPRVLEQLPQLDYLLVNITAHSPIVNDLFEQCLPYFREDSVFVLRNIHEFDKQSAAWQRIQSHASVTFTIEVLNINIVFFRKKILQKEHFRLLPTLSSFLKL